MAIVTTIIFNEIEFNTPTLHKDIWLYNANADDIEEMYKIDFVHDWYNFLNDTEETDIEKINNGIRNHYLKNWTHWALLEAPDDVQF